MCCKPELCKNQRRSEKPAGKASLADLQLKKKQKKKNLPAGKFTFSKQILSHGCDEICVSGGGGAGGSCSQRQRRRQRGHWSAWWGRRHAGLVPNVLRTFFAAHVTLPVHV